jgi:hypothetical protein
MKILDPEDTLDVPADIAKCPYCDATLTVRVTGSCEEADGSWMPDEIELECTTIPAIDSEEWDGWLDEHTEMPYVYWLPVDHLVTSWLQQNYRMKE